MALLLLEGLASQLAVDLQLGLRRLRAEQKVQSRTATPVSIRAADSHTVAHLEAPLVPAVVLSVRPTSRILH